jgi:hypothetical protein
MKRLALKCKATELKMLIKIVADLLRPADPLRNAVTERNRRPCDAVNISLTETKGPYGRQIVLCWHWGLRDHGIVGVETHVLLTSALVRREWSASRPGRFIPGERDPDNHYMGGWVGPRDDLDEMEKWKFLSSPGFEIRLLGSPASSQSLYLLNYPGSVLIFDVTQYSNHIN